jgi:hypothetical protein
VSEVNLQKKSVKKTVTVTKTAWWWFFGLKSWSGTESVDQTVFTVNLVKLQQTIRSDMKKYFKKLTTTLQKNARQHLLGQLATFFADLESKLNQIIENINSMITFRKQEKAVQEAMLACAKKYTEDAEALLASSNNCHQKINNLIATGSTS